MTGAWFVKGIVPFVDEQEAVIGIVLRVLKAQSPTTQLNALRILFE